MSVSKVWFVTGASRGFGRICVEAALKRGDKVAATARTPAALAGEVAAFGIKVAIIEPGQYATGFQAAVQPAPAIAAYDAVGQAIRASFKAGEVGDPAATAAAIFAAVDADVAPLRLVLGSATMAKLRATYAARLNNWAAWEAVSNAAQGS